MKSGYKAPGKGGKCDDKKGMDFKQMKSSKGAAGKAARTAPPKAFPFKK